MPDHGESRRLRHVHYLPRDLSTRLLKDRPSMPLSGPAETFGELLKYLRRRARLTQRELAIAPVDLPRLILLGRAG